MRNYKNLGAPFKCLLTSGVSYQQQRENMMTIIEHAAHLQLAGGRAYFMTKYRRPLHRAFFDVVSRA